MKTKTIISAVAVAMACIGARAAITPTNLESFVECIAAAERGETNAYTWLNKNLLSNFPPAVLQECDTRLSNIKDKSLIRMFITGIAPMMPKSAKAYAETVKNTFPNYAIRLQHLADGGNPKDYSAERLLDSEVELVFLRGQLMGFCNRYAKVSLTCATKSVRRQLRKEGLPIITVGGKDYAKERLDILAAALNAPRMQGVKEALAKCGIDITRIPEFPFIPVKGSKECDALLEAVYNGEKDFKTMSPTLRYALGVEEYNAFVTRYNSGN